MSKSNNDQVPLPLKEKKVIDLSQFIAGPTAAQYLADFGAEVIKIESAAGDGSRTLSGNQFGSYYTRSFNTGKSSHVLDLRQPEDLVILNELLIEADAFICNLNPLSLKKLGLDPDTLRTRFPHLVITLISGYGQQDHRNCMDTIAQCESGFAMLNGNEDGSPRLSTSWPIDSFSGLFAGFSTAMALLDATQKGCLIDISMMEIAASMLLGPAALAISEGDVPPAPMGNRDRATAPSTIYPCLDGYVYILGGLDHYWQKLRPLIGAVHASLKERLQNAADFDAQVEAWTQNQTQEQILRQMTALQIPAGAVKNPTQAVAAIRALRPKAISEPLPSGEHIPVFPALFNNHRLTRSATPHIGGKPRYV